PQMPSKSMSHVCGQRSRRQACAFGPCAASAICGKPRMASRAIRRSSIRRRLLLFLIPSLLLMVVGAAALTYYGALHVATFAYDRSLLDPALDMAANVRMEPEGPRLAMLKQAQEALLYDHEDTLIFQIRALGGAVIAGDEDLNL